MVLKNIKSFWKLFYSSESSQNRQFFLETFLIVPKALWWSSKLSSCSRKFAHLPESFRDVIKTTKCWDHIYFLVFRSGCELFASPAKRVVVNCANVLRLCYISVESGRFPPESVVVYDIVQKHDPTPPLNDPTPVTSSVRRLFIVLRFNEVSAVIFQ